MSYDQRCENLQGDGCDISVDDAVVDRTGHDGMSLDGLRNQVRSQQITSGPLGEVYEGLYQMRGILIRECFPEKLNESKPLFSMEMDPGNWRGKFMSTGAFGFRDVIVLNVGRFDTAHDTVITVAHELGHWFVSPEERGHGKAWTDAMYHRVGLTFDDRGNLLDRSGWWYDMDAQLLNLGLDAFRMRA